ncbi:MAG: cell wall-binding repeat-containing protein [Euzebya tangerina]|nr:cell wall-binding repeat-containing protein [Euzebya tangerina]
MQRVTVTLLVSALLASTLVTITADPAAAAGNPGYGIQSLVVDAGGDPAVIRALELTPDGTHAILLADLEGAGRFDLWSVPMDGSTAAPTRLNPEPVPADGDVNVFQLSPDSSRVAFVGDLLAEGASDLFVAPVDGSSPAVQLNVAPGDRRVPSSFTFTPDSARVVFRTSSAGRSELFSVLLDGSQPLRLNDDVVAGGTVRRFEVTPDGSRVVYDGDLTRNNVIELYSAPVDARGQQVTLNTAPPSGGEVFGGATISPDGSQVVFRGDIRVNDVFELFSVPTDGSDDPVRLTTELTSGGDVEQGSPLITPDGSRVIYRADQVTDEVDELFSIPIEGGPSVRLNSDPVAGGDVSLVRLAPDGESVVYRGDLLTNGVTEIFSAPVSATDGQVRLNDPLPPDVSLSTFFVSPDSTHVVFDGELTTPGVEDLYSAPIGVGGGQVQLSDAADPQDAQFASITPDGRSLIYVEDVRSGQIEVVGRSAQLLSVPIDGSGPRRPLSDTPVESDSVIRVDVSPDSSFVAFAGDLRTSGSTEVYAAGLVPTAVTDLTTAEVDQTSAELTWTAPTTGQPDSYQITLDPPDIPTQTTNGAATAATLTGLQPETGYTATVVAVTAAGNSQGATVTFTTQAAVDQPGPDPTDQPDPDPDQGQDRDPDPSDTGTGTEIVRLAGPDRFSTAATIALDRFDPDDVDTVLLATGGDFPDALAGVPLATALDAPILLTATDTLTDTTATALAQLDPDTVIALGGTAAISDQTLTAAGSAGDRASTRRLAGPTRFETATAIADALLNAGGDPPRCSWPWAPTSPTPSPPDPSPQAHPSCSPHPTPSPTPPPPRSPATPAATPPPTPGQTPASTAPPTPRHHQPASPPSAAPPSSPTTFWPPHHRPPEAPPPGDSPDPTGSPPRQPSLPPSPTPTPSTSRWAPTSPTPSPPDPPPQPTAPPSCSPSAARTNSPRRPSSTSRPSTASTRSSSSAAPPPSRTTSKTNWQHSSPDGLGLGAA